LLELIYEISQISFFGTFGWIQCNITTQYFSTIWIDRSNNLTYLGVKVSEQIFIFKRYQIYTSLAWLLVVVRAGSIGFADELLIYGNTSGNVFMIGGFLAILFGFFSKTSFTR